MVNVTGAQWFQVEGFGEEEGVTHLRAGCESLMVLMPNSAACLPFRVSASSPLPGPSLAFTMCITSPSPATAR